MTRVVRLLLAYDGTGFRGWAAQRDPSIRTVEGELSAAIERIVNERIELSVAGRTDAGVHARGQVTSFSAMTSLAPERIRDAVNAMLGPELVVRRASDAPAWFDARFSATAREYRYVIATGDVADPFTARYVWHRPGPLHVPSMRRACAALVGEHDFASFCRNPGRGRSTVRDLHRVRATRWRSGRAHVPRERVPASDGALARRDPRDGRDGPSRTGRGRGDLGGPRPFGGAADRAAARSHPRARHLWSAPS